MHNITPATQALCSNCLEEEERLSLVQRLQFFHGVTGKEFQGHWQMSLVIVARFTGVTRDNTLSERQRKQEGYRVVVAPSSLLNYHIFPWVCKRASSLSNYPTSFLDFPGPGLLPCPYPISFLDFLGACALLQSDPLLRFSWMSIFPLL